MKLSSLFRPATRWSSSSWTKRYPAVPLSSEIVEMMMQVSESDDPQEDEYDELVISDSEEE